MIEQLTWYSQRLWCSHDNDGCATAGRLLLARCVHVFCQHWLRFCLVCLASANVAAVGFESPASIKHVWICQKVLVNTDHNILGEVANLLAEELLGSQLQWPDQARSVCTP